MVLFNSSKWQESVRGVYLILWIFMVEWGKSIRVFCVVIDLSYLVMWDLDFNFTVSGLSNLMHADIKDF